MEERNRAADRGGQSGMARAIGNYYQSVLSSNSGSRHNSSSPKPVNKSDEESNLRDLSFHDFGEGQLYGNNKVVRTGRQRKKLAARTKGGEFQTKRKKRRVYFCCISSEIDVQKLLDHLNEANDILFGWHCELNNDVLHMYKPGVDEPIIRYEKKVKNSIVPDLSPVSDIAAGIGKKFQIDRVDEKDADDQITNCSGGRLVAAGSKEVFVFDFGAIVFWGFGRGEESGLLKTIRLFATKGIVGKTEFESGEDDMAFVTSPEEKEISVANDVITLPDETVPKQRLAVSFAIAQSSVLAIFEARIEQKVEEYKYIPETLAAHGKVDLSERQLGMMIGEVFVIRHDVNLHTEILDTPDFFWKEKSFEPDYKMVSSYLEMSGRTEILNKRLDMLRELLDVLQQQMENVHAVKLEWIVIYLIMAEVLLQGLAIVSKL
jgi:uncharacterized Rmd1/YagE family protein